MGKFTGPLIAVWLALPLLAAAAGVPPKGSLLIASPSSHDPELAHAIVLLLRSDSQGALGLVLNAPTPVPVTTLFPHARAQSMVVYKGGPLRMGINGLVREKSPAPGRSLVFGDVYLVSSKPDLETLLSQSRPDFPVRVYVGLCGWSAGQLASEIQRGVWSVHSPSTAAVFAPR
jgi:putative transcriptional regulator